MIGSRRPSAIRLIGFQSAIVCAGSSSRLRGKYADERNRITNTSGKMPCATLGAPALRASAAPSAPNAIAFSADQHDHDQRHPPRRLRCARRRSSPIVEEPHARERAQHRGRREPPEHERGARDRRANRRSMKPISMSSASAIAPLTPREHRRLQHRARELEVEEAVHLRERRQVHGAARAAGVDGEEQRREDDDRREELRPAEGLLDRAPAERRRPPAPAMRGALSRGAAASAVSRAGSCGLGCSSPAPSR